MVNNTQSTFLSLFPLDLVLFPEADLPLHIFEERYKTMFSDLLESGEDFGVVRKFDDGQFAKVGTTARIVQVKKIYQGRLMLLAEGVDRFEVVSMEQDDPYYRARIERLPEPKTTKKDVKLALELRDVLDDMIRLSAKVTGQKLSVKEVWPKDPAALSYLVPATFYGSPEAQQLILEMESTGERLEAELSLMEEARRHLAAQSAIKDAVG